MKLFFNNEETEVKTLRQATHIVMKHYGYYFNRMNKYVDDARLEKDGVVYKFELVRFFDGDKVIDNALYIRNTETGRYRIVAKSGMYEYCKHSKKNGDFLYR